MALLLVTEGVATGRCFPLGEEGPVSIGRDDQCTFQVLDQHVSRRHLQIIFEPAERHHVAADYRSANGVVVNGRRIVKPVPLLDGDQIKIGRTTLVYMTQDDIDPVQALADLKKKDQWKRSTLIDT